VTICIGRADKSMCKSCVLSQSVAVLKAQDNGHIEIVFNLRFQNKNWRITNVNMDKQS